MFQYIKRFCACVIQMLQFFLQELQTTEVVIVSGRFHAILRKLVEMYHCFTENNDNNIMIDIITCVAVTCDRECQTDWHV